MTTIYTFNNKVLKNSANDKWLIKKAATPFGPIHINLPDGTIRIRVTNGSVPTQAGGPPGFTATNVEGDIWDCSISGFETYMFTYSNIKSITVDIIDWHLKDGWTSIDTNCKIQSGWDNLKRVNISYCSYLTALSEAFTSSLIEELYLSNTSSFTSINNMCEGASGLKMVPYIEDVSSITSCLSAFKGCVNIESGIVNMYNRLSALPALSEIYVHSNCFNNCGINTVTGAAELAQIPSGWGGTGA